jgi:hypothetical protein
MANIQDIKVFKLWGYNNNIANFIYIKNLTDNDIIKDKTDINTFIKYL